MPLRGVYIPRFRKFTVLRSHKPPLWSTSPRKISPSSVQPVTSKSTDLWVTYRRLPCGHSCRRKYLLYRNYCTVEGEQKNDSTVFFFSFAKYVCVMCGLFNKLLVDGCVNSGPSERRSYKRLITVCFHVLSHIGLIYRNDINLLKWSIKWPRAL